MSVESIGMFCFNLRLIDLADKYCDGLFNVKGVPDLSLNRIIYFENCAWEENAKTKMKTERSGNFFAISEK